ncbi:MAG TPA: NAD(P)/FAD-dependent oxidoreductase, partial [Polyangiaceae bacterium]|nr:NAD(P)/FAD-dependent oxidoreductase [Polyangiaceae bacterium]
LEDLPEIVLRKRSLDARRGAVRFHLLFGFQTVSGQPGFPALRLPRPVRGDPEVVIVGDGPAGLFCAYELACHGIAAIVVDRGKTVQPRRHDLKALHRGGVVNEDSNYCFGEGGAGTYSDGKLYTRSHKRGNVRDVLEILALAGAPAEILTEARPHIGSNRLPKVVTALRERIEAAGSQFRFGARVVDILVEHGPQGARVCGVALAGGEQILARHVVLATGHSARDILEITQRLGLSLEPKAFALGVRIEHPQPLINRIQYGASADHPKLPNAAYRVAHEVEGRGVFSFCMCPGGWIVPASTEPGGLVVNGMSLARRDSPFANSGFVVSVEPSDWERAGFTGALGGVLLQRKLEQIAFDAGGGELRAPATRATDFVRRQASSTLPDTSYIPGLTPTNLWDVFEPLGLGIAPRLSAALQTFGRRMPGYVSEDVVLVGVESRTSCPVRLVRDGQTLQARGLAGLYPTGEGAGYAGGIVSAAIDGVRVAQAVCVELGVEPTASE